MKKIINIIISPQATAVLLLLLAVAMGVATFVEDAYDIPTGKALIYNTKWFELIMLLLAVNFIGNIKRFKLLRKEKLPNLTFHLAFIVMILGAGITRYFGSEGVMHIREGSSSNILYSEKPSFRIFADQNEKTYKFEQYISFNKNTSNAFEAEILGENNKALIKAKLKKFVPNAVEKMVENHAEGKNTLGIIAQVNNQKVGYNIEEGSFQKVGNVAISYNQNAPYTVQISQQNDTLYLSSPKPFTRTSKDGNTHDTIPADSTIRLMPQEIIAVDNQLFLVEKIYQKAKKILEKTDNASRSDAIVLDVTVDGKTQEITVFGGKGFMKAAETYIINGKTFRMAYGDAPITLPFSLTLDDFILDRYAGSMSPSSFESKVTLIDKEKDIKEKHRIYMNNVLDYRGYRFFQSSYDKDEKGTILSVNHDFFGTWLSYLGYTLLGIGFLMVFFSKESRFAELRRKIKIVQNERKKALLSILLILGSFGLAQAQSTGTQNAVSLEHANHFGQLVVQTYNGRFAPLQTLADDILHKISRKDKFDIAEKGKLTKIQVFLDIQLDPNFWRSQKIIYIREKSVRQVLGVTGKYASFDDFFDDKSDYKLKKYSEEAFRKKPVEQNKFDKEVIKLDERVNVYMMTLRGSISKIFPIQNSKNNNWVSATDPQAKVVLTGDIATLNNSIGLKEFSCQNLMVLYLTETKKATTTGDYTKAEKVLGYIKAIQNQKSNIEGFPTETQLKYEVFYNKANIFIFLRNVYGLLSLLLLGFAFYENLSAKPSKVASFSLKLLIGLLGIAFLYHTFGMGLRWYLTGHAPWSNGYEALLLVAWGGLLAGFGSLKNSKITIASAALMAFFMLMTAGHSSYDPQLTNLQPVLKSYWLIIHVAILTISYGFLGSGFLLGLINLVLYSTKNEKNSTRFTSVIKELTYVNEMNISMGTFLATIGTFLGGVWANESWGRYWGWDAKETWALVIVMVYAMVLHMRMIPKLKNLFFLNAGSVWAFSSVLMTFVGVNYYLSKGMHSYGAGDTPVFPLWAWGMIILSLVLTYLAWYKEIGKHKKVTQKEEKNT